MILAGVFYEKIALNQMGFADFTALQMGILEGSREINYPHCREVYLRRLRRRVKAILTSEFSLAELPSHFSMKTSEKNVNTVTHFTELGAKRVKHD